MAHCAVTLRLMWEHVAAAGPARPALQAQQCLGVIHTPTHRLQPAAAAEQVQ